MTPTTQPKTSITANKLRTLYLNRLGRYEHIVTLYDGLKSLLPALEGKKCGKVLERKLKEKLGESIRLVEGVVTWEVYSGDIYVSICYVPKPYMASLTNGTFCQTELEYLNRGIGNIRAEIEKIQTYLVDATLFETAVKQHTELIGLIADYNRLTLPELKIEVRLNGICQ